ncbi:MAG TPA: GvpL/GvpF family gas vesicle protein [Propionibacteriaceae bacterium]|nr:GvpL/GvpF family gas vesicle protein [Propionibacteriaceae bacterium]
MDETIVHAYGVVAADELLTQFPPGIADTTVWVHSAESLAAIVSLLPVEGFGVADWERNATNVGWLEPVARQHHDVLQHAAMTAAAVVPLRLPSLYGNLESLTDTLREAGDLLNRDLRRIEGKVEWAVKVYRTAEAQNPAASMPSTSGRDYLLARSRDLSARSSAQEALREQVREIHEALGQVSAEYVRNQPQDAVLSGRKEQMLLNGAYLVRRTDQARFVELAGEIADNSSTRGLSIEVSGPWPAYNFTGDAEAATTEART